jgi:hypothetical protein
VHAFERGRDRGRHRMRALSTAAVALTMLSAGVQVGSASDAAARCQRAKLAAVSTAVRRMMACHAKAAAAGVALPQTNCTTDLSAPFAVSESLLRGCLTVGDAHDVEAVVRDGVTSIVTGLRPRSGSSVCAAEKISAAAVYATALLDEAAQFREDRKPASYSHLLDSSEARLRASYARAETAGRCVTTRDTGAAQDLSSDLIGDAIAQLWPLRAVGVAFSKPPELHLNGTLFILGNARTLSFDNFHGRYTHGGTVPAGGADLVVAIDHVAAGASLTDLVAANYAGGSDATSVVVVARHAGTCVDDHTVFPGGGSSLRRFVYFKDGPRLFKIGVEYLTGDPTAEAFARRALTQVLDTFELLR